MNDNIVTSNSLPMWMLDNDIRTEKGEVYSFRDYPFYWDILKDDSQRQACIKAAQIGFSTAMLFKTLWYAKYKGLDIIYTLPTATDMREFAGGKINRIIAQNPVLKDWIKDHDTVTQKSVGDKSTIYYRGTWTQKAAMMVPSDCNVYDEVDASNQEVLMQYATRLQASDHRYEWFFSHPSAPGFGVDVEWRKSDQKHWFIKCSHCMKWQFMSWPDSFDMEKRIYQCKECHREIYDKDRRLGKWVRKYQDREVSGYWIPLFILPQIPADRIISYFEDKDEEYFYNKVLGLPYAGGDNKLTKEMFVQNLTTEVLTPEEDERIVIGIDTGNKIDYVMGGRSGLFYHGECSDYKELDNHMNRWKKAIAVIDKGGDLIGARQFKERWPGRVFFGQLLGDRKNNDGPEWDDDNRIVKIDRNRMIQTVVSEFGKKMIPVQGTEDDWYEYWMDWDNLTRIKVVDSTTQEFKAHRWVRSGRDHKALATVFWRVGMDRFGKADGKVFTGKNLAFQLGEKLQADGRIRNTMRKLIMPEPEYEGDWRDID